MVDANTFETVADWLRTRHRERGFRSYRSAAKAIEMDRVVYGEYVDGEKVPPDELIARLAAYYGDDEDAMLTLARRSRRAARRPGPAEAEPPPWGRRLLDEFDQLKAGIASLRVAHAGPTTVAPADAVRPLLEAAGYRGLLPVEVTTDDLRDRERPVLAGMVVWLDPLMAPSPGCVVGVQVGDELVLRSVNADGMTLRSAVPGRPPLRLDQVDRVVGVGRLAQSPL